MSTKNATCIICLLIILLALMMATGLSLNYSLYMCHRDRIQVAVITFALI